LTAKRAWSLSPASAAVILRRISATRLIYFLYQVVQIALSPALALYLLYRGIRDRRYWASFPERLGLLDNSVDTTGSSGVWLHAVSVGEVLSAVVLVRRLRERDPRLPIHVSTSTLAGYTIAEYRLKGIVDGVFYAPIDYRSVVRRVLRALRPSAVVILETEIWPNLYRETKRSGASLVVVNGRISDRALPRYLRWKGLFAHVLRWPDAILTQSEEDRLRYIAAGAPPQRVTATGNLKYDFTPATAAAPAILEFLDRARPISVWIAASTMPPAAPDDPDEDDAVIAAFRELAPAHPRLLLILAPRRPERFTEATEKLTRAGVRFSRRSALEGTLELPGVLLLDSIGELAPVFAYATAVFMGGTLVNRGGHNILEPAYFAKPVVVGPHMENFTEIAREFSAAGAVVRIQSSDQLAGAIGALLADTRRAADLGNKARDLAMSKRGMVDAVVQRIVEAMSEGVPDPPHGLAARVVLTPLSWLWGLGHRVNVKRSLAAQRGLETRIISVGGLTVGGAGKSPMVAHLAERLAAAGHDPAILTRGYRRLSAQSSVVVQRGEGAAVELTGDEAQMFVRAGNAHVGIGSDRFDVGRRMETRLRPDVFLLDDGFQHLRLKRDVDIVLVDVNNPNAGGLFPLGRRREPLENLSRASMIVLTNTASGRSYTGAERMLREHNPRAPIFHSRVKPVAWMELESGATRPLLEPGFRRVAAFCGLGSPRGFLRTLHELGRELGMEIVFQWTFGDHHRYRANELQRLARQARAAGAEVLVTTEKDVMNVSPAAAAAIAPMQLYWLKIALEIDNEEELLRRL
jgi:3-deoxy-D-manno-octulosonic-acid transferase